MDGIPEFEQWYEGARSRLKADTLAPFFVEIRNDSIHKGINPLNRVSLDHLQEHLFNQMGRSKRAHVLLLPDAHSETSTVLADAAHVSKLYFASLVKVVFECYEQFKYVVDPQWYLTRENFSSMGKTLQDAVAELGLPPVWASCAPSEDGGWRALRSLQTRCQINHLFREYLGTEIAGPDDLD